MNLTVKRIVIFLILAGATVYANTLLNQMFWDDNDFVRNNIYVQDWQYFGRFFTENVIAGAGFLSNYWRPALLTVFSLEYHLWGDWAAGYHFANAAFHIADGVLLFFILRIMFRSQLPAFLTAAIFLVHPLQTEAVAYVSSLGDSLSVFFMFLGIFLFLKFRLRGRRGLYAWSLLTYALALMSKETAIIMPGLIFLADVFRKDHEGAGSLKARLLISLKPLWPFLLVGGGYVWLRASVLNFQNTFNLYPEENVFTESFVVRLLTFFRILLVYFGLLFWPLNLHMERSVEIVTGLGGAFSWDVAVGGVLFLGLLGLGMASVFRFPAVSFGIFWFFAALAPTSNLAVPINGLLYEHWMYLPSIGIFLIVSWLGVKIAQKFSLAKVMWGVFALAVVFLGVLAVKRNHQWRDPVSFYKQTLQYAPKSYRVINNLGMSYAALGQHEQAEETYLRAIAVSGTNPTAYHNLANTYLDTGRTQEAIGHYEKALALDPGFIFSARALAGLFLSERNYDRAKAVLEKYASPQFSRLDLLAFLAFEAVKNQDYVKAAGYFEEALAIDPSHEQLRRALIEVKLKLEK